MGSLRRSALRIESEGDERAERIAVHLRSRKPDVYADAAYVVLNKPSREYTGNSLLCEDVLLESGVTDLSVYDCVPGSELGVDLWVDTPNPPGYTGP